MWIICKEWWNQGGFDLREVSIKCVKCIDSLV